ncbi:hypothetical protein ACFQ5M_04320 [Agrilactobacillus yilanensis]|uniref:Uncharacterized protein n=1 Tax=Agrilactobacillus yilanensis TaxID=2485997 RepID=A0ABW4J5Q7_9LACO|nr:hypothetical protein [Agrilactobacillus yilanensis]
MDYFKQRRVYRKLKREQLTLSMAQDSLYRELLDYAYDEGKLEDTFILKDTALIAFTGLSKSKLKAVRQELVEMGLLIYSPEQEGQQQPQYKIKPLYHTDSVIQQAASAVTQTPSSAPTRTPTSNATGSTKVLTSTRPLQDNNFKENIKERCTQSVAVLKVRGDVRTSIILKNSDILKNKATLRLFTLQI